jgi:hypothetical protein
MRAVISAAFLALVQLAALPATAMAQEASPAEQSGVAARDVVSFGNDVRIRAGESVPRDVFCMGCHVIVEGTVGRDVVVIGGDADIQGQIGRDVFVLGGHLKLGPNSSVGRDAVTMGGHLDRDPGAQVGRDVVGGVPVGSSFGLGWFVASYLFRLASSLALFILAVVLAALFPKQVEATSVLLEHRLGASFGLGCLGVIGGIALATIFAVTVILLPLSLAISIGLFAAWLLGWTALLLMVGRRILAMSERRGSALTALLAGGLVLGALSLVPFLGLLVGLLCGTVALGAALGSRFGTRPMNGSGPPPDAVAAAR